MSVSGNRQAVVAAVTKGKKISQRDQFIAEAEEMKNTSMGLLAAAANVNQMIRSAKEAGVEMDEAALNAAAGTLAKDLVAFRNELQTLDANAMAQINKLTPKTDELEVMTTTISVATGYQNWQERFAQITEPNLVLITEICTGEHAEKNKPQQGE